MQQGGSWKVPKEWNDGKLPDGMKWNDLSQEKIRVFAGYLDRNPTGEEVKDAYQSMLRADRLERKEGLTKTEDIKKKIDLDIAKAVLLINEQRKQAELYENNPEAKRRMEAKRRNREKMKAEKERALAKGEKGPGFFKVFLNNLWYYLYFIELPTQPLLMQNLIIFGGLGLISVFAQVALSTCLALGFALGIGRLYLRGLDDGSTYEESEDPIKKMEAERKKREAKKVKVVPLLSALCIMIGAGYIGGLLAPVVGSRLGLRLSFNGLYGLCTNFMFFLAATFLWVQPEEPEVEEFDHNGKKILPKLSWEEQKKKSAQERKDAEDW
jgi:hypothetical protein